MEFPSSGLKPLTIEEFDTTQHLAHAAGQASARGFDKMTLVDADTHLKGMLYLPLHHPADCAEMIEELGSKPGVAGCVVASARYEKVQARGMMRVFSVMEERGMVLAFHGIANWEEPNLAAIPRWG